MRTGIIANLRGKLGTQWQLHHVPYVSAFEPSPLQAGGNIIITHDDALAYTHDKSYSNGGREEEAQGSVQHGRVEQQGKTQVSS